MPRRGTDPRVVEAMLPYFSEHYGNAASRTHAFGWKAEEAVDQARQEVAALIGADAKEIVFTSGATESNNLALKGVAHMVRNQGNHIITCRTEHHAVLDPCRRLEREGFQVTYLPVDSFRPSDAPTGCRRPSPSKTILVSIMAANNEIGTLQPDRRNRRGCARSAGFCFTPTRPRQPARFRSMWKALRNRSAQPVRP